MSSLVNVWAGVRAAKEVKRDWKAEGQCRSGEDLVSRTPRVSHQGVKGPSGNCDPFRRLNNLGAVCPPYLSGYHKHTYLDITILPLVFIYTYIYILYII